MNSHKTVIQFVASLRPEVERHYDWRSLCLNMAAKHPKTFLELVNFEEPFEATKEEKEEQVFDKARDRAFCILSEHGPSAKINALKAFRDVSKCGLKEAMEEVNLIIEKLYPNQR